jgi:4'-phosphopantetheinyl transferase
LSPITDMEPRGDGQVTAPPGQVTSIEAATLLGYLPDSLPLASDTVHVWAFTLEGPPALIELCRNSLSEAERNRADRFIFERDRFRHTIAHGVLRHVLSRYCHIPPESLRFTATAAGKPSLWNPGGGEAATLQFNLSHSDERALLGVSAGRELGIDLEKVRSNIEALAISDRYFFGSERDAIQNAPSSLRDSTFFRYWVAKEAVLKAQGIGLGFPLDHFRVNFLPDGHAAYIDTLDPAVLESTWTVQMLSCENGWHGAVAARGNDWNVQVERVFQQGRFVTDPSDL